jgi:hypothetical protein
LLLRLRDSRAVAIKIFFSARSRQFVHCSQSLGALIGKPAGVNRHGAWAGNGGEVTASSERILLRGLEAFTEAKTATP